MKNIVLIAIIGSQSLAGCAAVILGPEALQYSSQNSDMFDVQDDINAGLARELAPSAAAVSGMAIFSGHFAVYDNDINDTELLFGDANLAVNFAASTEQLSGEFSNIRLVDSEGQRVYGLPAASVEESFEGTLDVVGTLDHDSVPFTAQGGLTDSDDALFDLRIVGDARFYEYDDGSQALSSAGATGFLTNAEGSARTFSTGFMALTE